MKYLYLISYPIKVCVQQKWHALYDDAGAKWFSDNIVNVNMAYMFNQLIDHTINCDKKKWSIRKKIANPCIPAVLNSSLENMRAAVGV